MANRSSEHIITARGQLIANPTAIQKPGVGSVTITGSSGSITDLTVDGVSIIDSTVAYDTSTTVTAAALADEINGTTSSPNYYAFSEGAKVTIYQQTIVTGTLTVTVTGTLTTTDVDVTGGAVGDGDFLGYTESGVRLELNDSYLEETTEESGANIVKIFETGGSPVLRAVCKQFDRDVLEARFRNRYDQATRVLKFPGSGAPGNDWTAQAIVLEFRPDDTRNPTVLARKACIINPDGQDIGLRVAEVTKVPMAWRLLSDDSKADTTTRVAAVGFAGNIVI